MCGRYVSPDLLGLEREYSVQRFAATTLPQTISAPDGRNYNVAPSQYTPVVRVVRTTQGARESLPMRWGLVPHWTNGEAPKFSTINATIEKLETAPTWRGPWRRGQRCIMPCVGFYEWQVNDDGELRKATLTGVFYPRTDPMTYTVEFSDYGKTKDISAPAK